MKLLLDENLPKKLKLHLSTHEVYTVKDKGWTGKKNGDLLRLLIQENFDCFLTFDKNISFQQNFKKYPICVFILKAQDNDYQSLSALMPRVQTLLLSSLPSGPIEITPEPKIH